jgi:hypothetical protein
MPDGFGRLPKGETDRVDDIVLKSEVLNLDVIVATDSAQSRGTAGDSAIGEGWRSCGNATPVVIDPADQRGERSAGHGGEIGRRAVRRSSKDPRARAVFGPAPAGCGNQIVARSE